jgi:hypothetical protein
MRTYTEQELGQKINKFLTKRNQRFPELRDVGRFKHKDGYGRRIIMTLEKASTLWGRYIHA